MIADMGVVEMVAAVVLLAVGGLVVVLVPKRGGVR